jgi:hypothetical protein
MIEFDDLEKARNKINEFLKLGDEIQKASPYLTDLRANIDWYENVINELPDNLDSLISNIEVPISNILNFNYSSFSVIDASGTTAAFYSNSGDTKTIIQSYGSSHYHLINEYDEINKTEKLIDRILPELAQFKTEYQEVSLFNLLSEAKETYSKWKAELVPNSILASDIRAFQDVFNGTLHRARVHTYNPIPKSYPDRSWPKMAEALAKKEQGSLKSLLKLQGNEQRLHLAFTEILKKTKEVDRIEMEGYFKDYIEHIYSIIFLIDEKFIK